MDLTWNYTWIRSNIPSIIRYCTEHFKMCLDIFKASTVNHTCKHLLCLFFAARQSSRSAHINTHTFLPLFPQLFTSKLFEPLACQPVKMAPQPCSQSHGLARRRKPQASWSSPRLPSSAPLETFGHVWIFERFMVYWAGAFQEERNGEKALEPYTGFRNLLLDNPATTDQCLYKRQKLWLEMRERAMAKQHLAASTVLLSAADRGWRIHAI